MENDNQNFIMAYQEGDKVFVDQCEDGVYTRRFSLTVYCPKCTLKQWIKDKFLRKETK